MINWLAEKIQIANYLPLVKNCKGFWRVTIILTSAKQSFKSGTQMKLTEFKLQNVN